MRRMVMFFCGIIAMLQIIPSLQQERVMTESQVQTMIDSVSEKYSHEIERINYEFESLKREMVKIKKEHSKLMNHTTMSQSRASRLLLDNVQTTVAFYVQLSSSTNISKNQSILYDNVNVNAGNGYNKFSGHFRAPVSGLYQFINTVMSKDKFQIHVEIMKNGKAIGYNYAAINGWESGTAAVIVELNMGDVVWIRDTEAGSAYTQGGYNTFSGFLIHRY